MGAGWGRRRADFGMDLFARLFARAKSFPPFGLGPFASNSRGRNLAQNLQTAAAPTFGSQRSRVLESRCSALPRSSLAVRFSEMRKVTKRQPKKPAKMKADSGEAAFQEADRKYRRAWTLREGRRLPRDAKGALTLFLETAAAGHVGAQYSAAHMLATGDGVRKNYRKAAALYAAAAGQGDTNAMYNLARRYEFGQGIPRDLAIAFRWYLRCAKESNDADAMANVADFYFEGLGVVKNDRQAYRWYVRAAEANHPRALLRAGYMAHEGLGRKADAAAAVGFYRRAARRGVVEAMFNLSLCLLDGDGTRVDRRAARRWLTKAARAGHREAKRLLKREGWA